MESTEIRLNDGTLLLVLHDRHGDPELWDGIDETRRYTVDGQLLRCPCCLKPSEVTTPTQVEKFQCERRPDGTVRAAWVCSEECAENWKIEVREGVR